MHVLLLRESLSNRDRVRPCESTRALPRSSFATPTVADSPLAVFGETGELSLLLPLLPQPANAKAATAIALPRNVMDLARVMLAPFVRCRRQANRVVCVQRVSGLC